MSTGQINLGTTEGNIIYNLAKDPKIQTIVESGTWNGLGSTMCIIQAQIDTNKKQFQSIELYPEQYNKATQNLKLYKNYVQLLNGTIVQEEDLNWFDHNKILRAIKYGSSTDEIDATHAKLWFKSDIELIKTAVNILPQLYNKIDLLILDGGEYTTYPEWLKLKDRVKFVVLDDTKLIKCSKIRSELLASNEFKALHDLNSRNGFAVFERATLNC